MVPRPPVGARLALARREGRVTRQRAVAELGATERTATRLLSALVEGDQLVAVGRGRGTCYVAGATDAGRTSLAREGGMSWTGSELAESVEYEVWSLNHYLDGAFPGTEDFCTYEFEVDSPGAALTSARGKMAATLTAGFSDRDVQLALQRLAPLAFQAAFKVQDMVIESILRANGSGAWKFSEKIREYAGLPESMLPPFFREEPRLAEAFFALYQRLSRRRNVLVHGSSFEMNGDGDLSIWDEGSSSLTLSRNQQRAYIETALGFVNLLVGSAADSQREKDDMEAALDVLRPVHNVSTPRRRVRWVAVEVTFRDAGVEGTAGEHHVRLDLQSLRRRVADVFPTGVDGAHRIRVVVRAHTPDGRTLMWSLRPDDVRGTPSRILSETDERCVREG
jgi:hypothetical protein